jgi:hypothetical protein
MSFCPIGLRRSRRRLTIVKIEGNRGRGGAEEQEQRDCSICPKNNFV